VIVLQKFYLHDNLKIENPFQNILTADEGKKEGVLLKKHPLKNYENLFKTTIILQ
jgi:hypothetical protein